MTTDLDPLLPEAEVDADDRPAIDWPTDPWDNSDRTGTVERLRRQTRPLKWTVYTVLCLSLVAIMVAGAVGWWYLQRLNPPGDAGPVEGFTVAEGETLESLSERLEAEGFVADAGVFVQYVETKVGDDEEFEIVPGFYELRPNDHVGNVMGRLGVPPAQTSSPVTFPEGFTLAQMARRVDTTFETLSAEGFLSATTAGDYALPWGLDPATTPLEGLLFPDTYEVSNADSESQVIQRMIDIMARVGNQEDMVEKSAALGRTPYEILIIASMIEREAQTAEDRPKISRVIHNRLAVTAFNPDDPPFRLQIDAAVLYGRNQLGIDPDTPFPEVRQIPSDWNTYILPALPKTPIASPGRASIDAALNPAPNPPPGDPICRDLPQPDQCAYFFYVRTGEDGSHTFAATGEQHEANVAQAAQDGFVE